MVSPLSLIAIVLGALCNIAPFAGPNTPTLQATPAVSASAATAITAHPAVPARFTAPAHFAVPARSAVQDYAQNTMPTVAEMPKMASPAQLTTLVTLPKRFSALSTRTISVVDTIAAQEDSLIQLLNRERDAQGEQPLVADDLLTQIARSHSADMCVRQYFDHYAPAPGPVTPMDRYIAARQSRPDYAMVGENIYYRSATDSEDEYAAEAHEAFMNSPGHRANILTALYTKVGVGIYKDPRTGEFWVTEMFLRDTDPK